MMMIFVIKFYMWNIRTLSFTYKLYLHMLRTYMRLVGVYYWCAFDWGQVQSSVVADSFQPAIHPSMLVFVCWTVI